MIKGAAFFPLKKGADPEKSWKFWVENFARVHNPNTWPCLKKYVIMRVIGTADLYQKREGFLWGMAEMYWDTIEDYLVDNKNLLDNLKKYYKKYIISGPDDEMELFENVDPKDLPEVIRYQEEFANIRGPQDVVFLDEVVVMDDGKMGKDRIKGVAYFPLKNGADPDEAWKVWVEKFAPTHNHKTWPRLKKYVINRISQGAQLYKKRIYDLWGIAEMYWDTMEDYLADNKELLDTMNKYYKKDITDGEGIRMVPIEEIDPKDLPEIIRYHEEFSRYTGPMEMVFMEEIVVMDDRKMLIDYK